jgi:hypothetical protein
MADQKRQGADGPERKSVSERKRRANRKNAQKSTGPRSRTGKETSKMNAVKHGILCDQLIIMSGEGQEDLTAFEQLLAGLREHYEPVGPLEDLLVQKMAEYFWKARRAQRHEGGAIQRQIEYRRDLETARREGRFQEALAAGASLEQSSLGIQHLLKGLEAAAVEVQRGAWSVESSRFLADHFRDRILVPPALEKARDSLPDDVDWKQLLKELKVQRDRLRERRREVEATEKREADARVRSYMLPEERDLDLVLRYEAAIDRKLHKVMDRLRQVQADRRAAEAAAGEAGGDQPAAA